MKKPVLIGIGLLALATVSGVALHFKHQRDQIARQLYWQRAMVAHQGGSVGDLSPRPELAAKTPAVSPKTTFDAASAADAIGDYNQAREGYLAAARLHDREADARMRLVLLTLKAGAVDEANHHYEVLKTIVSSGDPRLAIARAGLAKGRK